MTKEKPSFKQQNLPAWQPILTAGTVLPSFFLIGVAFVPIGIGLLMASSTVQEIIIDYTDCTNAQNVPCHNVVYQSKEPFQSCKCKLNFTVEYDYTRIVYAYYRLSNFYQNHRRYVRSRDDVQLLGYPKSTNKDCYPYDKYRANGEEKPIAPCGAIANSLFNDSFHLRGSDFKELVINRNGIAWPSDKKIRFRNPVGPSLKDAFNGTAKPPNWRKPVYELARQESNNGFQNEDLIVWMRTAALPTFRKLYGILSISQDNNVEDGQPQLRKGEYILEVDYNFPVKMFDGRKSFVLSDTSSLGGKNNFLGIAYIIVGLICFLISALFLFVHKKYGRLSSEMIQINQQTPYLSTSS